MGRTSTAFLKNDNNSFKNILFNHYRSISQNIIYSLDVNFWQSVHWISESLSFKQKAALGVGFYRTFKKNNPWGSGLDPLLCFYLLKIRHFLIILLAIHSVHACEKSFNYIRKNLKIDFDSLRVSFNSVI